MNLFKRIVSALITASFCATSCMSVLPASAVETTTTSPEIRTETGMEPVATNQLSKLMLDAAQSPTAGAETESSEAAFDSSIAGIDLEYGYADIRLSAACAATLVVALHDEKTDSLITSASAELHEGDGSAHVEFSEMPEDFFIVRAYLVDPETLSPLSEVFEDFDYTQARQEFFTKTVADFDEAHVLKVEDTNPNNLMVFSDDATIVQYSETQNNVIENDYENGHYVIENADDIVKSLKSGDMLVLYCGEELPLMVKVGEISADGDTVTITEGDTSLQEMFSFIRVDSGWVEPDPDELPLVDGINVIRSESTVVMEKVENEIEIPMADGKKVTVNVSFDNTDGIKTEAGVKFEIPLNPDSQKNFEETFKNYTDDSDPSKKDDQTETVKIKGECEGKVTVTLAVKNAINWDKASNHLDAEFSINAGVDTDMDFKGEVEVAIPLLVKEGNVPLSHGFYFTFNPTIELKTTAKVNIKMAQSIVLGFRYDTDKEKPFEIIRSGDDAHDSEASASAKKNWTLSLDAESTFYAGINVKPGIAFGKIPSITNSGGGDSGDTHGLHLKFDAFSLGLKATLKPMKREAKLTSSVELSSDKPIAINPPDVPKDNSGEMHLCEECIDAEVALVPKISAAIYLFDNSVLEQQLPKVTVEPVPIHLFYFYLSLLHQDGAKAFGFGKCPNRAFCQHFACVDASKEKNREISGAEVTITPKEGSQSPVTLTTPADVWMMAGEYGVSAKKTGFAAASEDLSIEYRKVKNTSTAPDGGLTVSYKLKNGQTTQDPQLGLDLSEVTFTFGGKWNDYKYEAYTNGAAGNTAEIEMVPANVLTLYIEEDSDEFRRLEHAHIWWNQSAAFIQRLRTIKDVRTYGAYQIAAKQYAVPMVNYAADGSATFYVASGTYEFTVSCVGYETKKVTVTVGDTGTAEHIKLKKIGETLDVKTMQNRISSPYGTGRAYVANNGDLYVWTNGGCANSSKLVREYLYDKVQKVEGIPDKVVSVSCDDDYFAFITEKNDLYTFGANWAGQLGNGTTEDSIQPVWIMGDVASVHCQDIFTVAVKQDGSVYYWGGGTNSTTPDPLKLSPQKLEVPFDVIDCIAINGAIFLALADDGSLYMVADYGYLSFINEEWGEVDEYYKNCDTKKPVKIMEHVSRINPSISDGYYFAVKDDGTLWEFGDGICRFAISGTLENVQKRFQDCGSDIKIYEDEKYSGGKGYICVVREAFPPRRVEGLEHVISADANRAFYAAVTDNGDLYTWGYNEHGTLGDGTTINRTEKKRVNIGEPIVDVATDGEQVLALGASGSLYAWGKDTGLGRYLARYLGIKNGIYYYSTVPIKVPIEPETADTASTESAPVLSNASPVTAQASVTADKQSASFTGLTPNALYNFYCMKSAAAEKPFANGNLLFMSQTTADADGNLKIEFTPTEACETADLFVVGLQDSAILTNELPPEVITLKSGDTKDFAEQNLIAVGEAVALSDAGVLTAKSEGTAAVYRLTDSEPELVCLVSVNGESTETTEPTEPGEPGKFGELGDVNGDGTVNAKDATMILIAAAKIGTGNPTGMTAEQESAADVNADGNINAKDATIVLRYAAAIGAGKNVTIADLVSPKEEVPAKKTIASGSCGENLTWTLDEEGTLTISGTGAMDSAPWKQKKIQKVIIEEGVTTITRSAFSECKDLTSVSLPDSLTEIAEFAFDFCEGLTSVTIPKGVEAIYTPGTFRGCVNLSEIQVDNDNLKYTSADGILFNKSMETLIFYPQAKSGKEYSIPDGVVMIYSGAFAGCTNLTAVTLPESLLCISTSAFSGCTNLESLTLPKRLEMLENKAFENCEKLTSITIPGNLSSIYDCAFMGCKGLTSLTIENGVTNISDSAFQGCESLTSVIIPESVNTIGMYAFADCTNLKSATIMNENCSIEEGNPFMKGGEWKVD